MRLLLLLFLVTPALADPFAGCKTSEPKPGQRHIQCADFAANATEEKPLAGDDATLDLLERALHERRLRIERGPITVGGVTRKGIRYFDAQIYGVMAAVPSSAGKFRVLFCEEKKAKRCDQVLSSLAQALPAPNAAAAAEDDSLAGRALPTPGGCTRPEPGKIHCAAGELTWRTLDADAPPGLDWLWNALKKAFAQLGTLEETRRACAVDGVASECRLLAIHKPNGAVWTVLAGMATVRGQRIFVQCNIQSAVGRQAAPPCDLLLTLR